MLFWIGWAFDLLVRLICTSMWCTVKCTTSKFLCIRQYSNRVPFVGDGHPQWIIGRPPPPGSSLFAAACSRRIAPNWRIKLVLIPFWSQPIRAKRGLFRGWEQTRRWVQRGQVHRIWNVLGHSLRRQCGHCEGRHCEASSMNQLLLYLSPSKKTGWWELLAVAMVWSKPFGRHVISLKHWNGLGVWGSRDPSFFKWKIWRDIVRLRSVDDVRGASTNDSRRCGSVFCHCPCRKGSWEECPCHTVSLLDVAQGHLLLHWAVARCPKAITFPGGKANLQVWPFKRWDRWGTTDILWR